MRVPARTTFNSKALSLFKEHQGVVNTELQTRIRRCFECEAGGVRLALMIPEIYARDLMLGDPLFQVRV